MGHGAFINSHEAVQDSRYMFILKQVRGVITYFIPSEPLPVINHLDRNMEAS